MTRTRSATLTTPDGTHLAHRDHHPAGEPAATFLLQHGLAGHHHLRRRKRLRSRETRPDGRGGHRTTRVSASEPGGRARKVSGVSPHSLTE